MNRVERLGAAIAATVPDYDQGKIERLAEGLDAEAAGKEIAEAFGPRRFEQDKSVPDRVMASLNPGAFR